MDIKAHIEERLVRGLELYVKDLEAIDETDLLRSPGGNARKPIDFTYEVAFVNRRISSRVRGITPPEWTFDGWIEAPEGFLDKQTIIKELKESTEEVISLWRALPAEDVEKEIETPTGPTSALKLMSLCATHLVYHDAQLNYLQSLLGDDEMHWG